MWSKLLKIRKDKLIIDSFWAVSGNGIGYGLLLLSGIFIARLLGKDLYGEYGIVKTTMFCIAYIATFGLNFTSTKYIAEYIQRDKSQLRSICSGAIRITLVTSGLIAISIFVCARPLAIFLEEPGLELAFQVLGVIVILKSFSTTQFGLLAGFREFKIIARNNVLSGAFMFITCIPFTFWGGLKGALGALFLTQVFNVAINSKSLYSIYKTFPVQKHHNFIKELVNFSFPIALQELDINICNLGGIFLITKLSSLGELGIYSATSQWNVCIAFMPLLLSNVILSHLCSSTNDKKKHGRIVELMLIINFVSTFIPFLIVFCLSGWIASWYGPTFVGMSTVLNIVIFATIFNCCSDVIKAEFISTGKNWKILRIRISRDVFLLCFAYWLIDVNEGKNAAYYYALAYVVSSIYYLFVLILSYFTSLKRKNEIR